MCYSVTEIIAQYVKCHKPWIFFYELTWPTEAKFHVKLPWGGGIKVCSGDLGHMCNMAAMPIYSKKPRSNLVA